MLSVLIVEDHKLMRELLVSDVAKMRPDASVTSLDSLDEALDYLHSNPCDLVLLDLDLRDASGVEGIRHVRAATAAAVVIVSATDSPVVKEQTLALGASRFLEKGRDLDEFYAGLREALGAA